MINLECVYLLAASIYLQAGRDKDQQFSTYKVHLSWQQAQPVSQLVSSDHSHSQSQMDSFRTGVIQPISQDICGCNVLDWDVGVGRSLGLEASLISSVILREKQCVQIFIMPCSLLVETGIKAFSILENLVFSLKDSNS